MFLVPPSPRQTAKLAILSGQDGSNLPENFGDFCSTLTIRSGKGFTKFVPFDLQLKLSESIDKHPFHLIAKTRQLGISEFCLAKILHECLKYPGYVAVVISRRLADAFKLSKRMQMMIDSINLKTRYCSASDITLWNGSKILFCQPGDEAARGEASVSAVFIDEFSFLREPELTLSAALPSTSMLGDDIKVMLVFTPNGKNNYAFKLLNESNPARIGDVLKLIEKIRGGKVEAPYSWRDNDGWLKHLLHWRSHPVYKDRPDYLKEIARKQKLPWKKVLREFDLSFEESEMQWLEDKLINACAKGKFEHKYRPGYRYYAGLDTSSIGKDYFAFIVLREEGEILTVAHLYRHRRKGMKSHLERIAELCKRYRIDTCMVEVNSIGQLYYESLCESNLAVNWQRFNATANTNSQLMERLLLRLESKTILYPNDSIITKELRALEYDPMTGKIEASGTDKSGESDADDENHDDVPRALALAIHGYETQPKKPRLNLSMIEVVESSDEWEFEL